MKTQVLFDTSDFPKQEELIHNIFSKKYDFILYGGAIRGGKTFGCFGALILLCRVYPGSRWAIVRDSWETLRRNTLPAWKKIAPASTEFNEANKTITFHNESQIIFFAENFVDDKDLNRWRGLEVNGFVLEEMNELKGEKKSFEKAFERAGTWIISDTNKQPNPIVLGTCNPSFGWVKDLIYTPWKNGQLKKRWKYLPAKITDNPFISKEYQRSLLENLSDAAYQVYVNGDWDFMLKTGKEAYCDFDFGIHVEEELRYDKDKPLWTTWDFNVNPYVTLNVWQADYGDLLQIDEICSLPPKNTTSDACKEFVKRYGKHKAKVNICGDVSGKDMDTRGLNDYTIISNELKGMDIAMRVPPSNPPVQARIRFINALLKGAYNTNIRIVRHCEKTIADYLNVLENADGTKVKKRTKDKTTGIIYEKWGHTSDANDYLLCVVKADEFSRFKSSNDPVPIVAGEATEDFNW